MEGVVVERLKDYGVCKNKSFFSTKKMYDVTIIQRSNVQEYRYEEAKRYDTTRI